MQLSFTISRLPVSLSIAHIPRSRLPQLSHPILYQILQPNPTFLNITCNEIELTLFAEESMLQHLEPIARRDRQRQRSRSGSGSSRRSFARDAIEPVEITYERWSVLQIDSHNDRHDDSGARVNELSAPLAAAGISILYQSSYMSDFIFVKESRLHEAISLFASAGFDFYNPDAFSLSPPISPNPDEHLPSTENPTTPSVMTRTRSSTNTSHSSTRSFSAPSTTGADTPGQISPPRTKSHSPTSGEVHVLGPELACVGLSDENVEHWSLKIIKLVAFPDLIPPHSTSNYSKPPPVHLSSLQEFAKSYVSSFTPAVLSPVVPSRRHTLSTKVSESQKGPQVHLQTGSHSPPASTSSHSSYSSSESESEDGYFSHSPSRNQSTSSLVTTSASRSLSDLPLLSTYAHLSSKKQSSSIEPILRSSLKQPSKHALPPTLAPLSPIKAPTLVDTSIQASGNDSFFTRKVSEKPHQASEASRVPFFSFTRTPEGSSLTTDVTLLATLFPPSERYMVICSGELDAVDGRLANMPLDSSTLEEDDADSEENGGSGPLKCLQIDLRRFGLDKHGLVNRFSRVLEESGINHMYSSTFKTANLLVDKKHATRAQALLRSC